MRAIVSGFYLVIILIFDLVNEITWANKIQPSLPTDELTDDPFKKYTTKISPSHSG